MTDTPSLPAQIEAVRDVLDSYEAMAGPGASRSVILWRAVLVTLQQHERTVSKRDTAQTICGEAYQAVGALAHYMGLSDHPDIIRLMDNLAYHDDPPHETLLPWPKEDLPNILQQHERLEAVVTAARDLLRHAGIKHPGADNVIVSRERARILEHALAAVDAAAPDKPEDAERGLRRDG